MKSKLISLKSTKYDRIFSIEGAISYTDDEVPIVELEEAWVVGLFSSKEKANEWVLGMQDWIDNFLESHRPGLSYTEPEDQGLSLILNEISPYYNVSKIKYLVYEVDVLN